MATDPSDALLAPPSRKTDLDVLNRRVYTAYLAVAAVLPARLQEAETGQPASPSSTNEIFAVIRYCTMRSFSTTACMSLT